jgi:UV DNA damage repair endonuclease
MHDDYGPNDEHSFNVNDRLSRAQSYDEAKFWLIIGGTYTTLELVRLQHISDDARKEGF